MKICTKCNIEKPESDFYPDNRCGGLLKLDTDSEMINKIKSYLS